MGNLLGKLPLLAQERILGYLRVEDAKSLMRCDNDLKAGVIGNRRFWVRNAVQLFNIDSCLFMRLKSHHLFDDEALADHVCKAHSVYLEAIGSVLANYSEDLTRNLDRHVETIAIDEEACLIAIHFEDCRTEVLSLLRLGDPPLRTTYHLEIHHMVLHGHILFSRTAKDPENFHTDVYNWYIGLPMSSLGPGCAEPGYFRLRHSDRYLLAYCPIRHGTMAYRLDRQGLTGPPLFVQFPLSEPRGAGRGARGSKRICDQATKDESLFVILELDDANVFYEFHIPSGVKKRRFLVGNPADLHSPRFAYPYIMVTALPCENRGPYQQDLEALNNFFVYGPRIYIPGSDDSIELGALIYAGGGIKNPSHRGQFLFIADGFSGHTKIIFIGDRSSPVRPIDFAERCYPLAAIVSFGLSVVFVKGSQLVYRRYYTKGEIFL